MNKLKNSKPSKRIEKLEKAGLMGCFNGTGVNSENYKKIIREDAPFPG